MKMWQKAKQTAKALTFVAAATMLQFMSLKAQLPNKLLDKAVVRDGTYNMKAQDSKLRLNINRVQGPGTLIDSMEYSVPIKVYVGTESVVDLGLGQGQMVVKNFDPASKQVEMQALNPDALIKDVLLRDNQRLVYTIDTTKPPQVGDDIWDVTLGIPDHPQSDGSYYLVQVHLGYSRAYTKNNMMLDKLKLPLGMIYSSYTAEKQVHFFFESLPARPYPGIDMPEHVKMTTDATFSAIKAYSGLCAGHPEEVVYPTVILTSMYPDPKNPGGGTYALQNANPQCGMDNSSGTFYVSWKGEYIRSDTLGAWLESSSVPNDVSKPVFYLHLDSTHYTHLIDFGFKPDADSTNPNHIFYPFDPLVRLIDGKTGWVVAQSPSEIKYNYTDVKIVSPDSLICTLSFGDLTGTEHVRDSTISSVAPNWTRTQSMKIFPNPASDEITIQRQSIEPAKYYIYTSHGIQVGEIDMKEGETDKRVNLKDLPSGELWITDRKHGLPVVIVR